MFKKYRLIWLAGALLTAGLAQAAGPRYFQQGNGNGNGQSRAEKIEALKVAFISERLNLTPEEAQKFWPIYNAYKVDLATLRQNFDIQPGVPLSPEQKLDFEQKKLDLNRKYLPQVEAAIGKQKATLLYNLDDEFRKKLKELQQQRQQQRQRRMEGY